MFVWCNLRKSFQIKFPDLEQHVIGDCGMDDGDGDVDDEDGDVDDEDGDNLTVEPVPVQGDIV